VKLKFYILIFFLQVTYVSVGQQQGLFSQYMFNGLAINPAYAGSHEVLDITALSRKQWVSVEGAPSTYTLSAHSQLKNEKVSLGLLLYNDKISIFNQNSFSAIYAYKIQLGENAKLSFGLKAGINSYSARYSQLASKNVNDPVISRDDYSGFAPSFGGGIYYYTPVFFAGISTPELLNILNSRIMSADFPQNQPFFLTAGGIIDINDEVKFQPSTLLKIVPGAPVQVDLNALFLFKEIIWMGTSLRNLSAMVFLTQIHLSEQFRIGYSYDLNLTEFSSYGTSTHELMVNYLFSFKKSKVVSPRYF
jgi:type IX secretion system PorP/SprF family membrane protein